MRKTRSEAKASTTGRRDVVPEERERKYRVDAATVALIRRRLHDLSIQPDRRVLLNRIYDHPRLGLRRRGAIVRLREDGRGRRLTYKGRGEVKGLDLSREEIELQVTSGAVDVFLERLGFRSIGSYRTARDEHRLGDVTVAIDEVQGEWFCELEALGPSADLGAAAQRLGLGHSAVEPRSYTELFVDGRRSPPNE